MIDRKIARSHILTDYKNLFFHLFHVFLEKFNIFKKYYSAIFSIIREILFFNKDIFKNIIENALKYLKIKPAELAT